MNDEFQQLQGDNIKFPTFPSVA